MRYTTLRHSECDFRIWDQQRNRYVTQKSRELTYVSRDKANHVRDYLNAKYSA